MSFTKKEINQLKTLLGQASRMPAQPKKKSKGGKKNPPQNSLGSGSYRVTRRVLLKSIESDANANSYGKVAITGATVPTIKTFLTIFQEYRFIGNIIVEYVPSCSSQSTGGLIIGSSLDSIPTLGRSQVASLSPVIEVPVWQRGSLTISPKSYQRAAAKMNKGDDVVCIINFHNNTSDKSKTFGELWMRFTAEFISPIA